MGSTIYKYHQWMEVYSGVVNVYMHQTTQLFSVRRWRAKSLFDRSPKCQVQVLCKNRMRWKSQSPISGTSQNKVWSLTQVYSVCFVITEITVLEPSKATPYGVHVSLWQLKQHTVQTPLLWNLAAQKAKKQTENIELVTIPVHNSS